MKLQFTTRDMFLMTTLIALGLSGLTYSLSLQGFENIIWVFALWVVSAVMIGAGIAAPFQKKLLVAVGVLVIALILLALYVMNADLNPS